MKKNNYVLLLASLVVLPLVGCGESTLEIKSIDPIVKTAIDSLREKSHRVHIESSVEVLRPNDPYAIDVHNEYNNIYGYYYEGNEKSFSRKINYSFSDLDKETGEPLEGRTRVHEGNEELYFKDLTNGTVYVENLSIDNEFSTSTMAFYDSSAGIYVPVIYDNEFKNPFDYISYRDVVLNKDGTLSLINEKADFLADCYEVVGLNFITDNKINLDNEGRIESISFIINDLVETNYTRKNTLNITFARGDDIKLTHLAPYTNNNPELQTALDVLDGKKNFTYVKEMTFEAKNPETGTNQTYRDRIKGYFTEEEVYFHHEESENDTHPYNRADNYDYKAIRNVDNKTYTGYEYIYSYAINGFDWSKIMLSSSAAYILEDFSDIGPAISTLNAVIFEKIDDKTYQVEDYFLPTIGKYFDNGFLGVQSLAFDGSTTKCVIKLDDKGAIEVIETEFVFQMVEYAVNFYIEDVGTTEIPSWSYDQTFPEN